MNTRLQVEHPVSEEVTGIDLVREMFRIADGEQLGYDDPALRGHSIEFRINAEDPARNFLPAPGTITEWKPPSGPGVRLDAGYTRGTTVPQAFDSLIGKLIITGADREQALQRSRRALAEFTVGGMPTVLPFHRAVVDDPAFTGEPFACSPAGSRRSSPPNAAGPRADAAEADAERQRLTVEVGGKRLEVPSGPLWLPRRGSTRAPPRLAGPRGPAGPRRWPQASGDSLVTPMQGTIVKIVAGDGQQVNADETVVVLEAMKMEQPLKAHKAGTISGLAVEVGQTVTSGTEICQIKD